MIPCGSKAQEDKNSGTISSPGLPPPSQTVDTKVGSKANASDVYAKAETYTKAEVDALIEALRTELTPPAQ